MASLRNAYHCFLRLALLAAALGGQHLMAQDAFAEESADLFRMPEGVQTRWASPENWTGEQGQAAASHGGRKGSPSFPLKAGASKTLAEVKGQSGTIHRIWFTIRERTPEMLRGLKLEMFWDGAAQPAVSAPFGDFFCQGLGRTSAFENALFASPEGRSFICYAPMPFRSGMKVVLTNESGKDQSLVYYDIDYTLGDRHGADMRYFHAWWHRERPTTMQKDFEILPRVAGRGRFLGACFSVIPDTSRYFRAWWGEGEVKAYLDGDQSLPTLAGTGTEDYIGTGWGQGQYAGRYTGCPIADEKQFRYAFYRLHVPDPVWFQKDCRVTIQQIGYLGKENGKQFAETKNTYYTQTEKGLAPIPKEKLVTGDVHFFERQDDWATCAWFYLDRPVNGLPALAPAAERVAGLAEK